ncbi:DNA methyltransferase [Natronosalvus amylolyticus]|uniref:DNA methyltransferase n=1 Tax=Natronosalvus amylolyticus TaxID=2961994 RepID=UPI0020CA04D9|nr:DNA methyltransferase [Natronosalvus amylolyticus]
MVQESLESLLDVNGVGQSTLEDIRDTGFNSLSDLAGADRTDLKEISGIGSSTADNILRFLDREGLREADAVTENQRKLQSLLRDLFQFDAADLDFGIYRIMNQKRDVIDEFIEQNLIQAVQDGLEDFSEAEREELELEVEAARQDVIDNLPDDALDATGQLNEEYRDFPVGERYIEAVEALESYQVSQETEAQVFNDLYKFFSRYYENGDFIPKRRYSSENKYAIPYNGEETHFYWANQNQYYIKTSEQFSNYRFRVRKLSISFELRSAHVETDDKKGEDRYFVLHDDDPIRYDADADELRILFEFRPLTDADYEKYGISSRSQTTQRDIRNNVADDLLSELPDSIENQLSQSAHQSDKRVLDYHLYQYTTKNTTDYFIHKDLQRFLERELEFYIKNEVVDLDGLQGSESQGMTELDRANVVQQIGQRIITFLAQIEEFQKKLYEKKKFVTKTEYCLSLENIPNRFYSQIIESEEQIAEWRELYRIEEQDEQGLGRFTDDTEIDEDFLVDHPYFMVDTRFFDYEFKHELLSTFANLDDAVDGVLVKGENFQALNLLMEKYREEVKCIYIDPPYNTGNDEFVYKDSYRHSSWLSMMQDRLSLGRELLREDGVLFSSIDDREYHRLISLLNSILGEENHIASFVWKRRTSTGMRNEPVSPDHEYVPTYAKSRDDSLLYGLPPDPDDYPYEDERGMYRSTDLTVGMGKDQRPGQYYTIENPRTGKEYEANPERVWRFYPKTMEQMIEDDMIIWPDEQDGNMTRPRFKTYYDPEESANPISTWVEEASTNDRTIEEMETEYLTSILQSHRNEHGGRELRDLLPDSETYYPKPVSLIRSFIRAATRDDDMVVDFFAGSGTTAHAVMDLNREDSGNRKYLLVEMGDYFDTVLKPRIKKVAYSSEWDDGEPQNQNGISQVIKYHEIESYEDSLDNISFSGEGQAALDTFDDYLLKYMLEFETQQSETRLNIDQLSHPFEYQLHITQNGEKTTKTVDLVETFNYLLGLQVETVESHEHQNRTYRVVRGSRDEGTVTVIWRNSEELDLETEQSFVEETLLNGDEDLVYVNGDSVVSDARSLESVFKNRMEA